MTGFLPFLKKRNKKKRGPNPGKNKLPFLGPKSSPAGVKNCYPLGLRAIKFFGGGGGGGKFFNFGGGGVLFFFLKKKKKRLFAGPKGAVRKEEM